MAVIGFVLLLCLTLPKECPLKSEETDHTIPQEKAFLVLRTNLQTQKEWVKVHAAEFLIWTGHPRGVREVFTAEDAQFGDQTPYRIGIWRVLAQEAESPEEKQKWIHNILQAFADENGNDRIHAAETLAKLRVSPLTAYPEITKRAMDNSDRRLSLYTRWSVGYTSGDSLKNMAEFFLELAIAQGEDPSGRSLAAYIIRQSGLPGEEKWKLLAESALSEHNDQSVRVALLNAAFVTFPPESALTDLSAQVYDEMMKYRESDRLNDRIKVANALAEKGKREHITILESFQETADAFNSPGDADLRSFAAYAILRISERETSPHKLHHKPRLR